MLTFAFTVLVLGLFGLCVWLYLGRERDRERSMNRASRRRHAVRIRGLETVAAEQAATLDQITIALREQKQINIPSKSNFSRMEDRYEQAAAKKVPVVNGQPVVVDKAA